MPFVQSAQNSATATSVTVTLGAAATVGNCLIVFISIGGSKTVSSVHIGGVADNFAVAKAQAQTDANSAIWTDQNCQQASTSVVVTISASAPCCVTVIEWSQVLTSAAVDVAISATSGPSNTWSSGASGTLAQANEVVFGMGVAGGGSSTLTGPGSPWTNLAQQTQGSSPAVNQICGYQQVSATTSVTYNGTSAAADYNVGMLVSLKLGGTITINLPLLQMNSAAFPLAPPIYVNLPLISDNIAALALTPDIGVVVNLPLLQINSAAFPVTPDVVPKITVALPLLQINDSAPPLTPDIAPVPPRLIIALASQAGTDQFANNYPQGVTEFLDQTHYANLLSGVLSFVANNLIGNNLAFIQTQDTPGLLDITSGGTNAGDSEAEMFLESSNASGGVGSTWAVTAVNIQINGNTSISGTLLVTNTGQFNGDLTVDSANLNVGTGVAANINLNPRIATPPNLAAVIAQTATLAQTQACLGTLVQSLQNRGLVNLCGIMRVHLPRLSSLLLV
jgi:hypothetical protein